ncbi:c-type cytochrome biogenesis protein CcmI [Halodurantibacterium flavum]|uniref:C-type cytochrome biogenesis protein CcmI n=1 Tax=Halodurantibacterium flavum TaxID=1382802 RepID=A0ABW4S2R4_9RHOB
MFFWIAITLMTLAVGVLLWLSVRRGREGDIVAAAEYDLRVYRDQLREIEKDVARRVIASEDAERLQVEVSRRILEADRALTRAKGGEATARTTPQGAAVAFAALIVLAGAGALGTYWYLGAPGYGDLPLASRIAASDAYRASRPAQADIEAEIEAEAPAPAAEGAEEYEALVAQLRQALQDRPLDLAGHQLLARNEAALGNFAAAHRAQAQVIDLKGTDATPDDYAELANLMILAAGGYVSPEAERALTETLRRDPQHGAARYYSGLMFAQSDRPDLAFRLWRPLLEDSAADDPWTPYLRAQIEEVAWRAGQNYTLPPEAGPRGPSLADIEAAEGLSDEARAAMVRGMVESLSARLNSQGGTAQEWARLIRAYGVLGETAQASAIWTEAQVTFSTRPEQLELIRAAAADAGVAEGGTTE